MTACTGTAPPSGTAPSAPTSAPSETSAPSGPSAPSTTTASTPGVSGTSFGCEGCGLPSEFRTAVEEFGFTDGFDPAGEQWRPAWGLYSELLLRTLMTYRHVAGSAGLEPVPDIADGQPVVSDDGLTSTFHLKTGIRFGPQVSREVTSRDVEYAFERIDTATLGTQSAGSFVGVIEGMTGTAERPTPISGIETPDRSTIVFHLLRPTGDFVHLLALPATAPVPKEVAGCFDEAGEYGRYLISTGPYMIASDAAYTRQSCSALRPLSGFGPRTHLELVPNPDYDPATDSPEIRSSYLTNIHIAVASNAARILDEVRSGALTATWATVPPTSVVREYEADPELRPLLHSNMDGTTRYIGMNLLVPPFDDIHVRRAMNLVMDREELLRQWGGQTYGDIATHVLPPVVLPGATLGPDDEPDPSGSLRAAKEEMARSRYDTDGDGICDAPECKNVIYIPSTLPPLVDIVASVVRRASAIGVTLKIRDIEIGPCDDILGRVRYLIPIAGCSAT